MLDKSLSSIGGKGVFISELESALLSGEIDLAVHSAKDLPLELAEGLEISAVLERGNYRDVLVIKNNSPIKIAVILLLVREVYAEKVFCIGYIL